MRRFTIVLTIIMVLVLGVLLIACDDKDTDTKYTITYDYDYDFQVKKLDVEAGKSAIELTIPARLGYRFEYWTLKGEKYDFSTPVNSDITLKAVWTKLVKVNVETNDGDKVIYLYPKDSYSLADFDLDTDTLAVKGFYRDIEGVLEPVDLSLGLAQDSHIIADYASKGMTFDMVDKDNARIVGFSGDSTNIVMPIFHDGVKVTHIGDNAFAVTNGKINSMVLPKYLIAIGEGAFSSINIDSFTVPASVETIGEYAFANSTISSLTFESESRLTIVNSNTFSGINNLTSLALPEGIVRINEKALEGCKDLVKVYVPSTITFIGGWTFKDCHSLDAIYLGVQTKELDMPGLSFDAEYRWNWRGDSDMTIIRYVKIDDIADYEAV